MFPYDQERLIADALLGEDQAAQTTPEQEAELPRVVMNNRPLRDVTANIVQVLDETNQPPALFIQSGRIVRLRRDERGQSWIEPISHHSLRRRLTQVADVVHESGDGERHWHVFPSRSVLLDVLAMDTWPFPPLEGIVETPIIRPEGTILDTPGYDPTTRLIYTPPPGFHLPPLPDNPSASDVRAALALIEEPLEGFPFIDEAAKANALSLLLTPVVRHAINGPVPLALIDAPQAGTGKSLLARVIGVLTTGKSPAMMTSPSSDEETRKRITATLSTGTTLIIIDNVDGPLNAPSLAAALTTDIWSDRILGASEMLTLPNRATWLATGNNIRPSGDLPRRCYWIRLDAKTSRPWQRTGFRYPDLMGWVSDHRKDYVSALLLLARSWYAAGQPEADTPMLGGFESWTRTIGGILHHAGVPGFLSNLEAMYAESDDGSSQWEAFLREWLQLYGDRRLTTAELAEDLLMPGENTLRDTLPDEIAEMLPTREGEEGRFRRRLGHAFRKRVEQRFGEDDLFLARAGDDTHRKVALWRVIIGQGQRGSAGSLPPGSVFEVPSSKPQPPVEDPLNPATPAASMSSPDTEDNDEDSPGDESDPDDVPPSPTHHASSAGSEVDYHLINDPGDLSQSIGMLENFPVLGIDTETTGLDPLVDRLRLIQLAVPDRPVMVIDLWHIPETSREPLKALLAGPTVKIFHNAKFDLKFLQQVGITVQGPFFDTMLASQVLDAGLHSRRHSLADLSHHFLGESLSKDEQTGDWSQAPLTPEQLAYAAKDAAILLRLREVMLSQLEDTGLLAVTQLECDCLPAVTEMERTGIMVDQPKLEALKHRLEAETNQAATRLRTHLQLTDMTDLETLFTPAADDINLDSPAQLLRRLQQLNVPLSNTSRWELAPLANDYPVVQALLAYRKVARALTFATSLPWHIHPLTGRIHASYWQLGAATGRFSCSDPNLQQIPKDVSFRSCFIASPGHRLVIADYSQIELRVAGELSGDDRMIEAYQRGDDLHVLTASLLLNKPMEQVTRDERQAAKAVNFGLIYAMGAEGLRTYAQNIYGVALSHQEAVTFRSRFFEAYEGLARWHEQIREAMPQEVRTLSGRRRQWRGQPSVAQLYNSPVQGGAADLTKAALVLLPRALSGTGARIIGTVHDEILLEAPYGEAEAVAGVLKDSMEQAGRLYLHHVPVVADVRIGTSWAEDTA